MTKTKTSKETSLEWAQKTYDKLKKKKDKPIKFRSGLEQQVAKLLEGLGISYGYETEVAELFGSTTGFKATTENVEETEDF